MQTYIAFLRGINLGKRRVQMEDLQGVFEREGYTKVRTLIASGNVIFTAPEQSEEVYKEKLEAVLAKRFGFAIPVILRTKEEIEKLIKENPFQKIVPTEGIRFQITLFAHPISGNTSTQKGFSIVYLDKREVGSVVEKDGKTTELMSYIDKTFGKESTTRNWNTIQKLLSS